MAVLHIDFETRSELDLRKVGLHRYARHPSTDVWCMAWAVGIMEPVCDPVKYLEKGAIEARRYLEHVDKGGAVVAHNAAFELEIWNQVMVPRYGWPELKPEQTFCTMAQAYAMGLPGALEDAALALGLSILKDTDGRNLMLRMARPRSVHEAWDGVIKVGASCAAERSVVWWDEPDKLARLYAYCQQDVRVERELHKRLLPLSDAERKVWLLDYKINQRGVQLDIPSVKGAIKLAAAMKEKYNADISEATAGAATTCTALGPIKSWLAEHASGVNFDSLDKQTVVDLLALPLPAAVKYVLTLRQEAGKASTAKFERMTDRAGDDGRLRQMYQYHGAATGRWAGRAVQTHNLPRDMPPAETVERILDLVRRGKYDVIDMIYGPPLTAVSRCLRSFFVAPEGKLLISGDFANVEGRGQAWFAGEDWKLKVFEMADMKLGPGIYELAYSRMFHVPVESVKNPSEERQVGKVSELAFGYAGGVGSFHVMSKNYGVKVSDAKANESKHAWREAHPRIVATWKQIQNAAINAVRHPGDAYECGYPGRTAKFKVAGSFLWCLLPSGRAICYPYPKLLEGAYGPQLTYMSVPSQEDKAKGKVIADPKNASNWARVGTYGGSLFNNIVQGFCRDLLVNAMLAMDGHGAPIVLHTHDDINVEVPPETAERGRELMERVMRAPPAWAAGFPLYAECKVMRRYGK